MEACMFQELSFDDLFLCEGGVHWLRMAADIIGGSAAAYAGAKAGAAGGAVVGALFGGAGAAPGAIIGGIAGGIVGFAGGVVATDAAYRAISK